MAIFSVALRISSADLSADEITQRLRYEPTRAESRGAPVSSRRPTGPTLEATIWSVKSPLSSGERDGDLDPHVDALAPVLELATHELADSDARLTLVVGLTSKETGFLAGIGAEAVAALARARAGLIVDVYSHTDEDDVNPGPDGVP